MKDLINLVYMSQAVDPMSPHDICKLLTFSRTHNEAKDITGVLLYLNNKFMQVIEGESEEILALYARIQQDSRHHSITLMLSDKIEKRSFKGWNMGYLDDVDINHMREEDFWDSEDLIENLRKHKDWNPAYEFLNMFYDTNMVDRFREVS